MKKTIFLLFIFNILLLNIVLNNNESGDLMANSYSLESELKSLEDYDYLNYFKYLKYIEDNPNVSYEDVILMVNNNIDLPYTPNLARLVRAKYFKRDNLNNYLINLTDDIDETVSLVNSNANYEQYTNTMPTDISKDTLMLVNKYNYLDSSFEPNDLEEIDDIYNKGNNNKLRKVAKLAFEQMCAKALLDNITLYNISAYRSFDYQVNIYNKNVENDGEKEADKTSARAGYSEHQTGLTLDINWISTKFEETDAFKWLQENAHKFGFILRYPYDKSKITGYSYEPWHYRYVGSTTATKIKEEGITFDEYYAYYVLT